MVDTGAQETILFAAYASQAHVGIDTGAGRKEFTGAGNRQTLPVNSAHVRQIEIGALAFQDWEFAVLPESGSPPSGPPVAGLLGMDFLHYFDLEFDRAAGKFTLWRLSGCKDIHPEWQGDYDAIPLKRAGRHAFTMPIYIDNVFLDVIFDTGAGALLLSHDAAIRAGATNEALGQDQAVPHAGIGGQFHAVSHRFGVMLIGNGQFDKPLIAVETSRSAQWESGGLIGLHYLGARKLWLSTTTDTLFVQPESKAK